MKIEIIHKNKLTNIEVDTGLDTKTVNQKRFIEKARLIFFNHQFENSRYFISVKKIIFFKIPYYNVDDIIREITKLIKGESN